MNKKLVLPGDHLGSSEEVIAGSNTYEQDDEVYSSASGEAKENEKMVSVSRERNRIKKPELGMDVYCTVRKISATKAFLDCTPAKDIEKIGSGIEISAVLPVANIKREHVREVRDELRVGDIVKAKIHKMEGKGIDVSIYGPEYGVVKAFCSTCRNALVLKEGSLICNNCERKERRKISDEYANRG